MSGPGRAIYLAPSLANPDADGASIGDYFIDPLGVEQGIAIVQGPNGARTLFRVAAPSLGPDTVVSVASTTGVGNRTLTFTVRDALGFVKPLAVFAVSLVGSGVLASVVRTLGTGVVLASASEAWLFGRATNVGTFAVSITGTPVDTVAWVASDIAAEPGSEAGSVAIP